MTRTLRALIAGETWITHTIHQKGFDAFTTTAYGEGAGWLRAALEGGGVAVDHLANHLAPREFPASLDALRAYDAVILSDIGSNTILLHPDTWDRSAPTPDRLALLRDYVEGGGGLVMVGGYLSFAGIDGRARYGGSPVEAALPVEIGTTDDRVEAPAGVRATVVAPDHPAAAGLTEEWPALLGYNRTVAKPAATVVARVGADPLLAVWSYGRGRAAAFTSDCGPHWCPPPFLEWPGYARLWPQLLRWVAGGE